MQPQRLKSILDLVDCLPGIFLGSLYVGTTCLQPHEATKCAGLSARVTYPHVQIARILVECININLGGSCSHCQVSVIVCGTGIKGPGRSVETVCEGREEKAYRKALICSKRLLYLQVCTQSACIRVESAPAFGVMISPPNNF